MKKYLLVLVAGFLSLAATAQSSKKYTLTFNNLESMQIKPVIQITGSIFQVPVEIENQNYNVMVYRTSKIVKKEVVEKLLQKNGFTLANFKSEEE